MEQANERELSAREREVVMLVAAGETNGQIALKTGLKPSTVKDYVANACRKAGVNNRTSLGVWWVRKGRSQE